MGRTGVSLDGGQVRAGNPRAGKSLAGKAAVDKAVLGGSLGDRGRLTEWGAIELLKRALEGAGEGSARGLATRELVGIGDDAAVLGARASSRLVWTIDGTVEHVHFERAWLSLSDVAYKATNAAVSDIAAMGARPVAALCHLVLPRGTTKREILAIGRGQAEAAEALGCPFVGGNISSGDALELVTTVLGESAGGRARTLPLLRSGARAGDELWLVGAVGLAAAGLCALQKGLARRGGLGECVRAWQRPRALVEAGRSLVGKATACLDVSDGLVADARHIAEASGVAVHVDERSLTESLEPSLSAASGRLGRTALDFALFGGEDYALLATGPRARRPRNARVIGGVERGSGVWLTSPAGRTPLEGGFEHFAASR